MIPASCQLPAARVNFRHTRAACCPVWKPHDDYLLHSPLARANNNMKHIPIRGVAIVLAIAFTACGLLLIAASARVDTYRGLPEIMLPPVQVFGTRPG